MVTNIKAHQDSRPLVTYYLWECYLNIEPKHLKRKTLYKWPRGIHHEILLHTLPMTSYGSKILFTCLTGVAVNAAAALGVADVVPWTLVNPAAEACNFPHVLGGQLSGSL